MKSQINKTSIRQFLAIGLNSMGSGALGLAVALTVVWGTYLAAQYAQQPEETKQAAHKVAEKAPLVAVPAPGDPGKDPMARDASFKGTLQSLDSIGVPSQENLPLISKQIRTLAEMPAPKHAPGGSGHSGQAAACGISVLPAEALPGESFTVKVSIPEAFQPKIGRILVYTSTMADCYLPKTGGSTSFIIPEGRLIDSIEVSFEAYLAEGGGVACSGATVVSVKRESDDCPSDKKMCSHYLFSDVDFLCIPKNQTCCHTTYSLFGCEPFKTCCGAGSCCDIWTERCCGNVCCPEGRECCGYDECCEPHQECDVITKHCIPKKEAVRTAEEFFDLLNSIICIDQTCGDFCIPRDWICCNNNSYCPPGSQCCDTPFLCCQHSDVCCGNTCCDEDELCCNGRCYPDNGQCCGEGYCTPGEHCCPGDVCCPNGYDCCGESCCKSGEHCCPGDFCCPDDYDCCGDHCCPKGDQCCGQACCKPSQTCCGDYCCSAGQHCCDSPSGCCDDQNTSGGSSNTCDGQICGGDCIPWDYKCCPGGSWWCTPDEKCCPEGFGCCPVGDTCCVDHCCPGGATCCGTGCCFSGTVCVDGEHCCPPGYYWCTRLDKC